MHVDPDALQELFGDGSGSRFESFLNALIRAEARVCRVPPNSIEWDDRVSVGEGGRDLVVRVGSESSRQFLPAAPSIWSIKSGDAGTQPAKLADEFAGPKRASLRESIRSGHAYRWCALRAASQGQRDAMQSKARALEVEHDLPDGSIAFFWRDQLAAWLNDHPQLIHLYLATWRSRFEGAMDLDDCLAQEMRASWVPLPGRDAVQTRIRQHLLGTDAGAVLHVAGLSGIGKTRTVIEACRGSEDLAGTLYFPSLAALATAFLPHVERTETAAATVIVDEVQLPDWERLVSRLGPHASRLRMVSIGPLSIREQRAREGVILLGEPSERDTAAVVEAAGRSLPEETVDLIAREARHDLRFALLLARAARSTSPGLPPWPTVFELIARIVALHPDVVGNQDEFRRALTFLCTCVDVGFKNGVRPELEHLARFWSVSETSLDTSMHAATQCGLGQMASRFFEAAPAGLARLVFEMETWPALKSRVAALLEGMPSERMRRSFADRIATCSEDVRTEAGPLVGQYFRGTLEGKPLSALADRALSRSLQSWIEFAPDVGLPWLARLVGQASLAEIATLSGGNSGDGGWDGRRQIVWLCEHLACFGEHFATCEDILFRLAQRETEVGIANNSQAVWRQLFWPYLSHSDLPFRNRFELLLQRLRSADIDQVELVMTAGVSALSRPMMRSAPPMAVGGRIVPSEWRPKTGRELDELQSWAARELVATVLEFDAARRQAGLAIIIDSISRFIGPLDAGELDDRMARDQLSESNLVLLQRHLAEYRKHLELRRENGDDGDPATDERLAAWLSRLEPLDLASTLRDVAAQLPWHYRQVHSKDEADRRYGRLAESIVSDPQALAKESDWFRDARPAGAGIVGWYVGQADGEGRLESTAFDWLRLGMNDPFVAGYFTGRAPNREGALVAQLQDALDGLATQSPDRATSLTLAADVSPRGVQRLLRALPALDEDRLGDLWELGRDPWATSLTVEDRVALLGAILAMQDEARSRKALSTLLTVVHMWRLQAAALLESLAEPVAALLTAASTRTDGPEWEWMELCRWLGERDPSRAIKVVVDAMTTMGGMHVQRECSGFLLSDARAEPELVRREVERAAEDPLREGAFHIYHYPQLFESIDGEELRSWVTTGGAKRASLLARHVAAPSVLSGTAVVPPLTEWLLRDFGSDRRVYSAFLAGRKTGEVRQLNPAGDVRAAERDYEAFKDHELEPLRRWARDELASAKHFEKIHSDWEDELGRV